MARRSFLTEFIIFSFREIVGVVEELTFIGIAVVFFAEVNDG